MKTIAMLILVLLVPACSSLSTPVDYDKETSALVGGHQIEDHPEVGIMTGLGSRCGATLIRSNIAVTAGHCVRFKVCSEPDCNLNRNIRFRSGTDSFDTAVTRIYSFMYWYDDLAPTDILRRDVTIVELENPVPGQIAAPVEIAQNYPARGDNILMIGYGCTDRCNPEEYTEGQEPPRQAIELVYGEPVTASCSGDSGGPTFDSTGRVFRVTSGSRVKEADDLFGDLIPLRNEIEAVMSDWEQEPWTGNGSTSMCSIRRDCQSCTARNACGWCADKGICVFGDWSGPIDQPPACEGEQYVWGQPECPGPAWRTPLQEPWEGDCSVAVSCDECSRLPLCGWAADRNVCVRGMPWGADEPVGDDEAWYFASYCCPGASSGLCADNTCDGLETCATCPEDCGLCEARCGDFICDPGEYDADCFEDCPSQPDGDKSGDGDASTDGDILPDGDSTADGDASGDDDYSEVDEQPGDSDWAVDGDFPMDSSDGDQSDETDLNSDDAERDSSVAGCTSSTSSTDAMTLFVLACLALVFRLSMSCRL